MLLNVSIHSGCSQCYYVSFHNQYVPSKLTHTSQHIQPNKKVVLFIRKNTISLVYAEQHPTSNNIKQYITYLCHLTSHKTPPLLVEA